MHTYISGPNFQEKSLVLRYIDTESALPTYNAHPYFSLKKCGQNTVNYGQIKTWLWLQDKKDFANKNIAGIKLESQR